MQPSSPVTPYPLAQVSPDSHMNEATLRSVAAQVEQEFLAEMLRAAGAGTSPSAFGGGAGEEQFSSFLLREQARQMVEAGGIGLAQSLFEALNARGENG
jgi:flagellar protein FlgJ